MNNRAIIFQRSSIGSAVDQENEQVRLESYANQKGLKVWSTYVASGEPNLLTVQMLIDHCMAWAKPGHILVSDLSRIWIGSGINDIIASLDYAGAIVHVVPSEVT